jgi:soluble lytic murein transglycosylase-like protein
MRVRPWIMASFLVPVLSAGEHVVLTSGFRLHTERHSTEGDATTLYDRNGGYQVIPTAMVAAFEPDEPAPPGEPSRPAAAQGSAAAAGGLDALVEKAARQYQIPSALVRSIIEAESGYNRTAVSPKGALGLMQLMPGTARDLRVTNPFDASQNIEGGTAYLKQLLERYQGFRNQLERAVAAYNAGPAKVDSYGGLPPYRETVDFVRRVSRSLLAGR